MRTTLSPQTLDTATVELRKANAWFAAHYPGESGRRQPVHSFYGGAHLFQASSAGKLGEMALRSLEDYAPDARTLASALGMQLTERLASSVYERITEKLRREPIEDFRIDF